MTPIAPGTQLWKGLSMSAADLPFLSAADLARLIAQKSVSPVEVTQAYLERIDTLDFKFNAYLTVCREEALRAARDAEQAILHGQYRGPMHGIPVAVKDQFWTRVSAPQGARASSPTFSQRRTPRSLLVSKRPVPFSWAKPISPNLPSQAFPTGSARRAIPGTWRGTPVVRVVVLAPPPPPFCVPRH